MAHWRAYASDPQLTSGTDVLVTGGRDPVRIRTGDLVSIEAPDRNRVSAVVVDRTGAVLTMFVDGRRLVHLHTVTGPDLGAAPTLSDGFSRENWAIQ